MTSCMNLFGLDGLVDMMILSNGKRTQIGFHLFPSFSFFIFFSFFYNIFFWIM